MQLNYHVSDTDLIIKGHKLTISVQGQLFSHIDNDSEPLEYLHLPSSFNVRDGLKPVRGNAVADIEGNVLSFQSKRDIRYGSRVLTVVLNGKRIGKVTL